MAKAKTAPTSRRASGGKQAGPVKQSDATASPAVELAKAVDEDGDDDDDADDHTTTDEGDSDEEDADADVSKRGLARLMQALGDDGLSDLDKAHLGFVTGMEEEDDDDDEEEEEEEGEEEEEDLSDIEAGEAEEEDSEADDEQDAPPARSAARNGAADSLAASIARSGLVAAEDAHEDDDEDEEQDPEATHDIPLESLSDAALAALPESVRSARTYREKINNEDALRRVRAEITLGGPSTKGKATALPWIETLVVPYDKSIQELVGDEAGAADDDLKRELEFYKQALHTATQGRALAGQANLPFTRPSDYFAEMVKSDEHMERVRQRLLDERAGLKASEEARKQRELKKFGKKVQVEKQLERQRSKRDFDDKVKGFKRKRQGPDGGADDDGGGDDDFDVRLESAMDADRRQGGRDTGRGGRGGRGSGARGGKMPRTARDAKYGFGGKKRHSKENTRESTNDFGAARTGRGRGGSSMRGGGRGGRGGSSRGGGAKRPGKARRAAGRG